MDLSASTFVDPCAPQITRQSPHSLVGDFVRALMALRARCTTRSNTVAPRWPVRRTGCIGRTARLYDSYNDAGLVVGALAVIEIAFGDASLSKNMRLSRLFSEADARPAVLARDRSRVFDDRMTHNRINRKPYVMRIPSQTEDIIRLLKLFRRSCSPSQTPRQS